MKTIKIASRGRFFRHFSYQFSERLFWHFLKEERPEKVSTFYKSNQVLKSRQIHILARFQFVYKLFIVYKLLQIITTIPDKYFFVTFWPNYPIWPNSHFFNIELFEKNYVLFTNSYILLHNFFSKSSIFKKVQLDQLGQSDQNVSLP